MGGILLLIVMLLSGVGVLWGRFRLRHLARVMTDPIKIVFTYSQVRTVDLAHLCTWISESPTH